MIKQRKISILNNGISNIEKSNVRHLQQYNLEDDIGHMLKCAIVAHIDKIENEDIKQHKLYNELDNELYNELDNEIESDLYTFIIKYLNDINIDQFRYMLDRNRPLCCSSGCLRIQLRWFLIGEV
jgi:hypothetical protein